MDEVGFRGVPSPNFFSQVNATKNQEMVFLFDCWVNLIGFFYCVDCNFNSIVFPPSTQLLPSYNFNGVMKYGLSEVEDSWPYLKWMSFNMCHMMTSLPVGSIKIRGILGHMALQTECNSEDVSAEWAFMIVIPQGKSKINCYVKTVSSFLISTFCLHDFIIKKHFLLF